MKIVLILLLLMSMATMSAQEINPQTLEGIFESGKIFTSRLKNGDIEQFRNAKPPKDTWTFPKLQAYKEKIESKNILYGSILIPSANKKLCSYNLFALDMETRKYHFVAIVSYKLQDDGFKQNGAYLFTEEPSLKSWWKTVFSFYESEEIKSFPKKYLYEVCPPPPFDK